MRSVRRLLVGAGAMTAGGLLALASAAGASAHVTPDPPSAPKGAGDQTITFRVPNELPDANTVEVTLQLPQDHPIASVDVLATPGWTDTIQTRHLSTPIKTDDGSFSDVASVITWTGGKIAPGQFGDFTILAQGLPTDTDQLVFKALQTYDNGKEVDWIETQPGAENPAPIVKLTAEVPDDASSTATTVAADTASGTGSSANAAPAVVAKTDYASKGLAIGALVVGALGLVVAIAAVVLGRTKSA